MKGEAQICPVEKADSCACMCVCARAGMLEQGHTGERELEGTAQGRSTPLRRSTGDSQPTACAMLPATGQPGATVAPGSSRHLHRTTLLLPRCQCLPQNVSPTTHWGPQRKVSEFSGYQRFLAPTAPCRGGSGPVWDLSYVATSTRQVWGPHRWLLVSKLLPGASSPKVTPSPLFPQHRLPSHGLQMTNQNICFHSESCLGNNMSGESNSSPSPLSSSALSPSWAAIHTSRAAPP